MATPAAVARRSGVDARGVARLHGRLGEALGQAWSKVLSAPTWALLIALTIGVVLRVGLKSMPNITNQASFAAHPMHNSLASEDSFIWWNWLSPTLAHVVGIRDYVGYSLLCGAFSVALLPAVYLALRSLDLDVRQARWRTVLACCLPASFTAMFWVGMDSLTLLLLALVVAAHKHPAISALLGLLCGLQHAEQTFIAIALLAFAHFLYSRRYAWSALAALVGVALGKLVLMVLVHHVTGAPVQSRWDWFLAHHSEVVRSFAQSWPVIAWSVFGAGWLLLLGARLGWREWTLAGGAFVAGLGMSVVSADATRVACITTLPAMLVLLSRSQFSVERLHRRLLVSVALILPAVWVWNAHNQLPLPYAVWPLV